jgi:pyruvate/2-oxoglutarate dehydrogenase complex dihydrolipoamide dehydrogenase (E3) component
LISVALHENSYDEKAMKSHQIEALQPLDVHNQKLQSHVHPDDYENPTPAEKYNLVVVGAGTAGLVAASIGAGLGGKVALIERSLMGGDCLNVGCVPSKGIISAARAAAAVRDAGVFGVRVPEGVTVDFSVAMERMRKLRSDISPHDSVKRFNELGVDVFLGQARFLDVETVEVEGQKLKFTKAVICTGARASAPPIKGLDTVPYLTNETLFSLTELPKRLGVIGAGPIGAEMAQSFARFGSEVSLITSDRGLMPNEDREASAVVQKSMEKDGVHFLTGARYLVVSKNSDGSIRLVYDDAKNGYDIEVDQLLVAVGRAPNVEGLGLDKAGVAFTEKGVSINDTFQTTNRKIYAAGDICSPYQFTHAADFMARSVVRNALFKGRVKHSSLIIPWSTYTSPELAHVGLTPQDAGKNGQEIDTYTQPMSGVDRAILEGETEGFIRVHVKKGTDQIVGATVVSTNAGDLIGAVSLAMTNKIGLGAIANAIHPYPTQAEALRKVGDLYNRTKLTPLVAKMFKKWLAWTR